MKLTNLSLAIMVALGVAACGGSDNTDNTPADPPAQNPAPKADENKPQEPEAKNDDKLVDPTGTHVVDGRDLSKESTVGGLQYIRRDSSDYDRVYNPDKMASSTPLLGVSLDVQNPKLTNIVLARRDLEREENKAVRAQFAGGIEKEPLTLEGKEPATPACKSRTSKTSISLRVHSNKSAPPNLPMPQPTASIRSRITLTPISRTIPTKTANLPVNASAMSIPCATNTNSRT